MTFACSQCERTFSRSEHLRRHGLTHSPKSQFPCFCGKRFQRRDALQRHMNAQHGGSVHHPGIPALPLEASARRACEPCARAHTRCAGGHPCMRCHRRRLSCVYQQRRPRRGPRTDAASPSHWSASSEQPNVLQSTVDRASLFTRTPSNWLPYNHDQEADHASTANQDNTDETRLIRGTADDGGVRVTPSRADTILSLFVSTDPAIDLNNTTSTIPIAPSVTFALLRGLREAGTRYVDGTGARISEHERSVQRLLKNRIPRLSASPSSPESSTSQGGAFAEAVQQKCSSGAYHHVFELPNEIYVDILRRARGLLDPSDAQTFPDRTTLERLISIFFAEFHPVYPFLDEPLLCIPLWGWSISLATAVLGARYVSSTDSDAYGDRLSLLVCQLLALDPPTDQTHASLPHVQASLINAVSLCLSCQDEMVSLGFDRAASAIEASAHVGLLAEMDASDPLDHAQEPGLAWLAWRCRETRRRTGIFAWILDAELACIRLSRPILDGASLKLKIPCSETLWAAESWQQWCALGSPSPRPQDNTSATPFLQEEDTREELRVVMAQVFRTMGTSKEWSDFTKCALVYSLIHRSWDVARFYDDPFSGNDGVDGRDSLAEIDDYARWRNGACDYLDAVHWEALAQSAQNHGVEGALFNDLHLARILLLAPVKDLLALVHERTGSRTTSSHGLPRASIAPSSSNATMLWRIRAWARKDCHKARLTVVHAGAIFWHVRRYASASLIQPHSVLLAALVMWAFAWTSVERRDGNVPTGNATLQEQTSTATPGSGGSDLAANRSTPHSDPDIEIDEGLPMVVNIDRPVDDEFVQKFVRGGGGRVTLSVHNVRDICTRTGARDVLLQAAHMLRQSTAISWVRRYADALTSMAQSEDHILAS